MLADLDVQPGSRILEIGAATGYNAALLAYLTGPTGHVTTIEILPEAAEAARRHLATAGFGDVRVVCGDGMLGDPDGAPYDRIIATAGVWDIPPAWMEQAASDARMVMPLRISGYSCRVALHRDDRAEGPTWRSDVVALDGFIPMRGIDERPERNIALAADGAAELRVEGVPADPDALAQAAGQTPVKRWSGATINGWDHTSLAIWLAALGGTGWVFGRKPGHSLADLTDKSVRLAVLDHGDTFGYLAYRPAPGSDGDEIGVYTYGPHGEHLADLVVDRLRTWSNQHATLTTWVEIYPVGIPIPATDTILLQVDKQYVSVIVRTASSVTGC
jgi:protein-L-isoaspartate(D-aspartate) O-methyltransferase